MVTSYENPEYMLDAIRAGAAGYVLKEATKQELLGAVKRVLEGEFPFDHEPAMRLLRHLADPPPPGRQGDGRTLSPADAASSIAVVSTDRIPTGWESAV
jgi:DNA-binding NarL/FixJ family response regulator